MRRRGSGRRSVCGAAQASLRRTGRWRRPGNRRAGSPSMFCVQAARAGPRRGRAACCGGGRCAAG
eukprot:1668460-Lingulodinium_polyedra.AAC.1